jgi:recombination protein RecA
MATPSIINAISKKYGSGCIAKVCDAKDTINFRKVPTGIFPLDVVLRGGLPESSMVEFYGQPSSLKTTCALQIASSFTAKNKHVAIIDIENSITEEYVSRNNVNTDLTYIVKPKEIESALDILEALVESKEFGLIIFDSIGAAIAEEELDKSNHEHTMAKVAQRMTKVSNALLSRLQPTDLANPETRNNTLIIFINQIRDGMDMYGPKERTKGGNAVKHNALVRLNFHKAKKIMDKDEVVGMEFKIKVEKSKVSEPYKVITFNYFFKTGKVDNVGSLLKLGVLLGVIKQSGAFYSYDTVDKSKGKEQFIKDVVSNGLLSKLQKDIINSNLSVMNDEKETEEGVVLDEAE